jgi:hypothetical protein
MDHRSWTNSAVLDGGRFRFVLAETNPIRCGYLVV